MFTELEYLTCKHFRTRTLCLVRPTQIMKVRGERVFWWTEPIARWADAFAIQYRIEHGSNAVSHGQNSWFCEGEDWCLQLTPDTYVRFNDWHSTGELRGAFAWTIFQMAPEEEIRHHAAEDVLERLDRMTLPELCGRLNAKQNVFGESANRWSYPGYLFVIDRSALWEHAQADEENRDHSPWHQTIPDVLEATIQSFWHVALRHRQTVIVYVSAAQLSASVSDLPDVVTEVGETLRLAHIRRIAELISTAIAEDAFLDARVIVSKRLQGPADAEAGLASTVLALRMVQASKSKITVFGETPLELMTRLSDSVTRDAFWSMTAERALKPLLEWPEEWLEMVDGLVRANLNVSEAARLLYVHRNTLISRIERLNQVTGFDVRDVQDAMVLYLAAMLSRQQPAPKRE